MCTQFKPCLVAGADRLAGMGLPRRRGWAQWRRGTGSRPQPPYTRTMHRRDLSTCTPSTEADTLSLLAPACHRPRKQRAVTQNPTLHATVKLLASLNCHRHGSAVADVHYITDTSIDKTSPLCSRVTLNLLATVHYINDTSTDKTPSRGTINRRDTHEQRP